jgi:transglutaminase-like putative cysteine protease
MVSWVVVSIFVGLLHGSTAAPVSGPTPSPSAGAVKPPQWLVDEAARPLPSLPPETEAVVLLDSQATEINAKGVITTACRRATRVLRQGGIESAQRLIRAGSFDTKVRSMNGWVINPAGAPRQVTMKQVISSSLAPDTLYMDTKMMILVVPEVDVGSVVGFEWEEERTPPSVEDADDFQGEFPVLRAVYSLSTPTRWEPELSWVNWTPVEPKRDPVSPLLPRTLSLEILNIPAIDDEPCRPNERALAGRLLVRVKTVDANVRSFSGWPDMGTWYAGLSESRRVPDAAVAQKAKELTAGAPDTLSKIRALAEFTQKEIRYVSIQIGIGGFQPHPAASVLANRYGDCKDKATLLAALLKAIGIDSDYIVIDSNRGTVTLRSPVSLYSFNHVVLAIRLPDDVPDSGLDSLVRHPQWGRLLIFDPTMPTTPLGRLPFYLQDNTGLLVAGGSGELIRLPRPAPEGNLLERQGKLVLTSDGSLAGEILETRRGSEADLLRYQMQSSTDAERRKYLETFLARSFASFSLQSFEFKNLADARGDLVVGYRFVAASYAKRAGGYLVVRPRIVGNKAVDLASKGKKARIYPIDLETTTLARDEFTMEIPEGWAAESLPKPVALDSGFAVYTSRTEAAGRTLVYRREFRLLEPLLPASRYDEALKFYQAVGAEEQQSLLLKTGISRRP